MNESKIMPSGRGTAEINQFNVKQFSTEDLIWLTDRDNYGKSIMGNDALKTLIAAHGELLRRIARAFAEETPLQLQGWEA